MDEREVETLIAQIMQKKERWLYSHGSGDTQIRGGYIEGIQDAIDVVSEFFEGKEREMET